MFLVLLPRTWHVQFSSSTERLAKFWWCIAKGRHLFPFRTEQLSLSAPMVLGGQPPGRVGRRRFFIERTDSEPPARAALCRSRPRPACVRTSPRYSAGVCERAVGVGSGGGRKNALQEPAARGGPSRPRPGQ